MTKFLVILPDQHEHNYVTRLKKETIPDFANQTHEDDIPKVQIFLALLIHLSPLLINEYFQLIPKPIMLSYAIVLSPKIVELLCSIILRKKAVA